MTALKNAKSTVGASRRIRFTITRSAHQSRTNHHPLYYVAHCRSKPLLGLAGAAASALAGLADWSEVRDPQPRRIGAVHALLNIGATALFASSCLARNRNNNRPSGRALAAAAFTLVALSAHLGGNLVYEHGVGVRSKHQNTGSPESNHDSEQGRCLEIDLD